jgi:preprotein translocase subunit SecE
MMARQGGDKPAARERRSRPQPGADLKKEKTGPRQYLAEVRGELTKVAWPTRREVFNSTVVVQIAVVFMTTLIFQFDYASSNLVHNLYA